MLSKVNAGPYTISGVSVGGVYTSLSVPQLGVMLDVGIAPRSFAAIDKLFLSHGHADHAGALTSLLGLRGLMQRPPLRVFMPREICAPLCEGLAAMSQLQRYELAIAPIGMAPGDEHQLRADLWVRAFQTHHPVPSLGYQFFHRVKKLRQAFRGLPGPEIASRKRAGEDLFYEEERLELAYATDTLIRVIDTCPAIANARVLILECSFLDERKDRAQSRAGCHIHLDDLLEYADRFNNEHLVLMHFSQIYRPDEVKTILAKRCPKSLLDRIIPFVPKGRHWPG